MDNTEKFWDRTADSFDKTEKRFEQAAVETIEYTRKFLDKNDIVLDYGCAKGTKTFEIADYVKKIYGIDISSKMIAGAKTKAVERNIKNLEFIQATIFDERFNKGSFDVVLAFNILHLVEDSQLVVQRIAELLKPGGMFISTTPCLAEKMDLSIKIQFSFFRLLMKTGWVPQYVKRFKISELEDIVTRGKFKIVEVEKLYHGLTGYFIAAKKI